MMNAKPLRRKARLLSLYGDVILIGWIPLFSGMAGALVTLVGQNALQFLRRPKLSIDCQRRGTIVRAGNRQRWYARLYVSNVGYKDLAQDVEVLLTNMQGETFEVLALNWAQSLSSKRNIPASVGYFVDLCYTTESDFGVNCVIALQHHATALVEGKNLFEVVATAANAKPIKHVVELHFDGTFAGLKNLQSRSVK